MDRKSILILVVCGVLFVFLQPIVNKLFPPIPVPPGSTNQVTHLTVAGSNSIPTLSAAPVVTPGAVNAPGSPVSAVSSAARLVVRTNIPEELLAFTNENAIYTFTSRGGGIRDVQLLHFPEKVSRKSKSDKIQQLASLNDGSDAPILSVIGDESLQGDGVYKLTRLPDGVRAEMTLANGLSVEKEFHSESNYLMNSSVRWVNRSGQGLAIPSYEIIAGTSTPMSSEDNGFAQTILWYNGSKTASVGLGYFATNTTTLGFWPRTPSTQYLEGNSNVVWLTAQNQYFLIGAMPEKSPLSVVVRSIKLPEPTTAEIAENHSAHLHPQGLKAAMLYPSVVLENGQTLTNNIRFFIGPKEYQTAAAIAAKFNNDFDLVMNFGWVAPVSKALLLAMNWLHSMTGLMYGIIIILITVMLKLIFWPITRASTRSAKRMQALQPQLKALQEKYKDDQQKLSVKQWEFYKENKLNPLSGCLPALLQIPVFFGFYGMLRTAIELRGAHFLWMADLSKSDTLFSIPLPLHFLGFTDTYFPINPMPLILGCTQLLQGSMMPMSPTMDASQQKMMRYMPLMALLFMYSQSSGLALYWTVSNLLSILQTRLTTTEDKAVQAQAPITVTPKKIKK